jgi:hypothetical protein
MTAKKDPDKDGTKRSTSEKPVSLHPIPFEDALRDLLNTAPPKKQPDKKTRTKSKN